MKRIIITTLFVFLFASASYADMIDLTTSGSSGDSNGALFYDFGFRPAGTGYIDPFWKSSTNEAEYGGYNTSYRPLGADNQDMTTTANWNHDLLLSDLGIVTIDGVDYYEFLLDINQNNGGLGSLLSLDTLQLFESDTPATTSQPEDGVGGFNLVYEFAEGDWIKLDYDLHTGSGEIDMAAYIPVDLFSGMTYVVLYSHFGSNGEDVDGQFVQYVNNDGFEEWAAGVSTNPVPEPSIMLLLGTGLAGLVGLKRRKK